MVLIKFWTKDLKGETGSCSESITKLRVLGCLFVWLPTITSLEPKLGE